MEHTLRISVSKEPAFGGIVSCSHISVRERLLCFLLGEKRRLIIIVPGDSVRELAVREVMDTGVRNDAVAKRKTAGYARVSTDSEEPLTSYEAQVDYYTNYIKSRPKWEFAGVYTDEGISVIDTRHRDGFNKMVQDALDGKIDLTVTKFLSRFARNTVDSLTSVRKLKEKGVESTLRKRTSTHLTPRASFSSPACPCWRRKSPALFLKM